MATRTHSALLGLGALALAGSLTSCGGGGGGGGGAAPPPPAGGGGGGGTSTLQANFTSIQTNVFTPLCSTCHTGAAAPAGLRLDSANSFALLVGVASAEVPALQRVDPGSPNDSYLIRKLEGTQTVGGRMPLGGTPLSQADINVIRQWITDGALPPGGTPPAAPIRVTSLSPLPGSTVSTMPMSVMAVFDRELDATSVDATTFLVERSGGDGTFGDGNEVAITAVSVSVPSANPMTAVLDMSTSPSVPDTYRVRLLGAGAATIRDLGGNSLDGEFTGTLPSGDGTQGGDFVATFVVEGIQATLQSIQDNVFTPICAGCHTGVGSVLPGSLDLTSLSLSYVNLVGVASVEVPALMRVAPNDPDNSYLVQKLEGTAAGPVGTSPIMPPAFAGPALDQATVDKVREWIANGAPM